MIDGQTVSSQDIAAFDGMVEAHARRFMHLPHLGESHLDDLIQEGRIAVFKAIRGGFPPSNLAVTDSMRDYAKVERRKGLGGFDTTIEDGVVKYIPRFVSFDELTEDVAAR